MDASPMLPAGTAADQDRSRAVAPTRVDVFAWGRAIRDSTLPAQVKGTLLMLATWMGRDSDECWPTVKDLALAVGRDRSTVLRHLDLAEREGYVQRVPGSWGRSTSYSATVPQGRADAPLNGRVPQSHHRDPESSQAAGSEEASLSHPRDAHCRTHATPPAHDLTKGKEPPGDVEELSGDEARDVLAGSLVAAAYTRLGCTPERWDQESVSKRRRLHKAVRRLLTDGHDGLTLLGLVSAQPPPTTVETYAGLLAFRLQHVQQVSPAHASRTGT